MYKIQDAVAQLQESNKESKKKIVAANNGTNFKLRKKSKATRVTEFKAENY